MYSESLTGIRIDAIYHTSIVLNGVEYYFGQGIQMAVPGSTHHGQPMEVVRLGRTELPLEVVEEYIASLGEVYTPESYDLFLHNCNNFTQDLAVFLVGKSIPEHIRNLPQTFLGTPLGQMLRPQIEAALRGVAQGPRAAAAPSAATRESPAAVPTTAAPATTSKVSVQIATNLSQLESQLASASKSCAVVFFTSSTCPPCKMVYPTYDQLAEEAGDKGVLIKCDVNAAYDVSMKYNVRATPTFMTFLKGEKLDEWSGANPAQLQGNVRLLLQMAHPPHPHSKLRLPSFQRHISKYITYKNIPPLDKLVQKLGSSGSDPRLTPIIDFIKKTRTTTTDRPADTPLPSSLALFAIYVRETFPCLASDTQFALVDLVRVLFLDPRVSGYFAESEMRSQHQTILTLLSRSDTDEELATCPYNLRIVMLHLTCNLFTSPLYAEQVIANDSLRTTCVHLLTSSLLDAEHASLRVVAASLAYNLAVYNHNIRCKSEFAGESSGRSNSGGGSDDPLPEDAQVELTASLIEAISREETSGEALRGLVFALGLLVYGAPVEGAVVDLCRAMDAWGIVKEKKGVDGTSRELLREVKELLSG